MAVFFKIQLQFVYVVLGQTKYNKVLKITSSGK